MMQSPLEILEIMHRRRFKVLDVNFQRKLYIKKNECDIAEVLCCIQAWHEMYNPGHHNLVLFSDGSGYIEAAHNYPPAYEERRQAYREGKATIVKLVSFMSLQEFIARTRQEMETKGWSMIDRGSRENT